MALDCELEGRSEGSAFYRNVQRPIRKAKRRLENPRAHVRSRSELSSGNVSVLVQRGEEHIPRILIMHLRYAGAFVMRALHSLPDRKYELIAADYVIENDAIEP